MSSRPYPYLHAPSRRSLPAGIAFILIVSIIALLDVAPAMATTVSVSTEAEFKAALVTLSSDSSGPHTVELLADITYAVAGHAEYSGSQPLTIEGNGHTIDANGKGRILNAAVPSGATVTLRSLTLQGGVTTRPGGAGAAVLLLTGDLDVFNSTIRDNLAGGGYGLDDGGGLGVLSGDLTLVNSSVVDNVAEDAAGVYAVNVVAINSTIANNTARPWEQGGGIFGETVTLVNSTVTGNSAGDGSGVYSRGPLNLIYSTVTGNLGGPNVEVIDVGGGSDVTSYGSVVASSAGQNCAIAGSTISTYSYDDDGSCGFADPTDTSNGADPLLGALSDNGGPTLTRLPATGSPLIDAIPAAACDATYTADQRGISRPQGTFCDIGAVEVIVPNLPPVADANGPYVFPLEAGPFDGTGSSDPDGDTLVFDWDFGDGVIISDTGAEPGHTYADAGIYDVCVTVTDPSGETDSDCSQAVIYDPSAGFVTGGGRIYSPPGAYTADPLIEGYATFRIVSKYRKAADQPRGITRFVLRVGDLKFKSTAYQWLVVTGGDTAIFKGTGTINGTGDYAFMVWAGDTGPDTFRIKIWSDTAGGEIVVYDNGPAQPIARGNIAIHTKKK